MGSVLACGRTSTTDDHTPAIPATEDRKRSISEERLLSASAQNPSSSDHFRTMTMSSRNKSSKLNLGHSSTLTRQNLDSSSVILDEIYGSPALHDPEFERAYPPPECFSKISSLRFKMNNTQSERILLQSVICPRDESEIKWKARNSKLFPVFILSPNKLLTCINYVESFITESLGFVPNMTVPR